MSLGTPATILLAFVGLYPVISAGFWIAGALVFHVLEEGVEPSEPERAGRA